MGESQSKLSEEELAAQAKKDKEYAELNSDRTELRDRGLDTIGRKQDLQQRLLRAKAKEDHAATKLTRGSSNRLLSVALLFPRHQLTAIARCSIVATKSIISMGLTPRRQCPQFAAASVSTCLWIWIAASFCLSVSVSVSVSCRAVYAATYT